MVEFEYGSPSKNIISLWANELKADKLATSKHLLNMVDPDGFVRSTKRWKNRPADLMTYVHIASPRLIWDELSCYPSFVYKNLHEPVVMAVRKSI